MTTPKPPRSTRADARARIEEAASRLFAERGFVHTTVDDIVRAAGVSKPALYRSFESKQHLHRALLEQHRDRLATVALAALGSTPGSPVDRLEAMIDAWFAHVEAHPFAWRMLFRDTTADPETIAVHEQIKQLQVANDIALLRQFAPTIPEAELEPLGEVMRVALATLALWWMDRPEVPRSTPVAAMVRVCHGILLTAS